MVAYLFAISFLPVHHAKNVESNGGKIKRMRACAFLGINDIRVEEAPRPQAGTSEPIMRVTLTTICGTDLHIVSGEYPIKAGCP